MALTEGTYRIVKAGSQPVQITLAGNVKVGDPLGYSSGWYQADANAAIYGELIAGEDGYIGEVITAYTSAVLGGFSGGTTGGIVYLSDTAGQYSESVGTVTQALGQVLNATEIKVLTQNMQMSFLLLDSIPLTFGTGGDVTVLWDGTNLIVSTIADDKLIEIGDSATTQLSFDLKWYGGAASGASFLYADASVNLIYTTGIDVKLIDDDHLLFGTTTGAGVATGDIDIYWDATNLVIKTLTDDNSIYFGKSDASFKRLTLVWYGSAETKYLQMIAATSLVRTADVDIKVIDSDHLLFGTATGVTVADGDVDVYWDTAKLCIATLADDTVLSIGIAATPQLSFDLKWYGNAAGGADYILMDASLNTLVTVNVDVKLSDSDHILIGTGTNIATADGDVDVYWDGTRLCIATLADDGVIRIGIPATPQLSFDLCWYGGVAAGASYLYFDASDNLIYTTSIAIQIKDNDYISFGTGAGSVGDVEILWNTVPATDCLQMACAVDDTLWEIGVAAATQLSFDLKWYGGLASGASFLYAKAAANLVYTTGVSLKIGDADHIYLGNGTGIGNGDGDVTISWNNVYLYFMPLADDYLISFGEAAATQLSFDIKIYGNAANGADYVLFDASASRMDMAGAYALGLHKRAPVVAKTAGYGCLDGDSGTIFTNTGAGAGITFTLPVVTLTGWQAWFFATVAQTIVVTSVEGNNLVAFNDAAATSVSFATGGQIIGGGCYVVSDGARWLVMPITWADGVIVQTTTLV